MNKRIALYTTVIFLSIIVACFLVRAEQGAKESINFFPLDPNIAFKEAKTALALYEEKDNDEYSLKWEVQSDIGQEVYLRQDIGFLFADGQLIRKVSEWKENIQKLNQVKKVIEEDSSHFQAISFHHGEIHYENDEIKSNHKMSSDQLYVIDSPKQPLESFKVATTSTEKEWKKILDHATNQQLKYSWMQLVKHYNIPIKEYKMIPLTNLAYFNNNPIGSYSMEQTQIILGKLWEGLYKNYFLGLKKNDGTTIDSIGSTIPLILFNDNHIIVLIETDHGEPFQLIQYIEENN